MKGIIKETTEHVVQSLKIKVKDLEDELEMNDIKISDLEVANAKEKANDQEHLGNELNLTIQDKGHLEARMLSLQAKETSEKQKIYMLFEKMNVLVESRICLVRSLVEKMKNMAPKYVKNVGLSLNVE